jgi:hypothetical protein
MMRLGERLWTRSFDASKMAYEAVRPSRGPTKGLGGTVPGSVQTVPIIQHGAEWLTKKDEGCGYMEPLRVVYHWSIPKILQPSVQWRFWGSTQEVAVKFKDSMVVHVRSTWQHWLKHFKACGWLAGQLFSKQKRFDAEVECLTWLSGTSREWLGWDFGLDRNPCACPEPLSDWT